MNELPEMFAKPWNLTMRIGAWRVEVRQQGRDTTLTVPCRLLHFHSQIDDIAEEPRRLEFASRDIGKLRGFVADSIWTGWERRHDNNPCDAAGAPALGYLSKSGADAAWWSIGTGDESEFDKYLHTIEQVATQQTSLEVFMYGHKAMQFDGDRGEISFKAPIMHFSMKIGMGDFPEP